MRRPSPVTDFLHDVAADIATVAITILAVAALASPFAIAFGLALPFVG